MGIQREEADNTVIARAVAILAAFTRRDSHVGFSELARRTALPKSTVFRLVTELSRQGLLERVEGGYRPTVRLFELGSRAPLPRELQRVAMASLHKLSTGTESTANVAVLDGMDIVYVSVVSTARRPLPLPRIGSRLPAHLTALGKAMLAHRDQSQVEAALRGRFAGDTSRGVRQLLDQFLMTRELGLAYDNGAIVRGLMCSASPVLGSDGNVVAAVSASGWPGHFRHAGIDAAVKVAAAEISRLLKSRLP